MCLLDPVLCTSLTGKGMHGPINRPCNPRFLSLTRRERWRTEISHEPLSSEPCWPGRQPFGRERKHCLLLGPCLAQAQTQGTQAQRIVMDAFGLKGACCGYPTFSSCHVQRTRAVCVTEALQTSTKYCAEREGGGVGECRRSRRRGCHFSFRMRECRAGRRNRRLSPPTETNGLPKRNGRG